MVTKPLHSCCNLQTQPAEVITFKTFQSYAVVKSTPAFNREIDVCIWIKFLFTILCEHHESIKAEFYDKVVHKIRLIKPSSKSQIYMSFRTFFFLCFTSLFSECRDSVHDD